MTASNLNYATVTNTNREVGDISDKEFFKE
jgi:hypothetical protein